jgi:uncharacterized membrane protein/transglutaminase-like putative cysteine protease
MMAADDVISVGRFLSNYSTSDVQNNELRITYSVFNQQDQPVHGALLTTTLQSGVAFKSATQLPDQSGQELAWSLGTIDPFGWASIELIVSFNGSIPLQLDDGAEAFGTVDARAVSDAAPAARLRSTPIDPALLASTPDANTSDPYLQAKAAQLDHDPIQIFQFLTQAIGYESYTGSLRGARGTLWSDAGNSLDEASLGIALLRSSGIPARYAEGQLSFGDAQQLILSMFPESLQTVGYLRPGAQTANPANDGRLLGETLNHHWLQFDTGAGFVDADPAFADAVLGQPLTTAQSTFNEVPDELRHKVNIRLNRELATPNLLGGAPFLDTVTVLDTLENTAALVGRPLTIGQDVTVTELSAIFTTKTTTYSPYVIVAGDSLDSRNDLILRGQDFQEVLTSFPFGSQILTGVFLEIDVISPDGDVETYKKTLGDRIGLATRRGGVGSATIQPDGPPLLSSLDFTTINALPSKFDERLVANYAHQLARLETELQQLLDKASVPANNQGPEGAALHLQGSVMLRTVSVAMARARLGDFLSASDALTSRYAENLQIAAYFDSPRLTLLQSSIAQETADTLTLSRALDLLKNDMRAVVAPGQDEAAAITFQIFRGYSDTGLETATFGSLASTAPGIVAGTTISAQTIFQLAESQGIGLTVLMSGDGLALDALELPLTATILIGDAIAAGKMVVVPSAAVEVDGEPRVGWYETNIETGETIGVLDDGSHGLLDDAHNRMLWQSFVTHLGQTVMGYLAGTLTIGIASQVKALLKGFVINQALGALGIGPAKAAMIEGLIGAVLGTLKIVQELEFRLPTFFFGYSTAVLMGLPWLKKDPAIAPIVFGPSTATPPTNQSSVDVAQGASTSAGTVQGSLQTPSVSVIGDLQAAWNSPAGAKAAFRATALNIASASVQAVGGGSLGSGSLSLASGAQAAVSIAGAASYSVAGNGSLAFYSAATSNLGASGEWTSYAATVNGSVTIELTTDALVLNGNVLPPGTYRITTSLASLSGSGESSAPEFAGAASVTAAGGVVHVGPAVGSLTLGGNSFDAAGGLTLAGYAGSLAVTPGATADNVQLSGTAGHVLRVRGTPAAITTDQNTPREISFAVDTSLAGAYELVAIAPPGWTVQVADSGIATVTPAPGLQGGTFPVSLIARSKTDPDLVAQGEIQLTLTPTQPGVSLAVEADPLFYVPFQGAQVPTAYLATIHNLGPAADTFALSYPDVPAGFEVLNSSTTVTIPAGQSALVGMYLRPTGSLLAPGTPLSFTVTTTSTTDGQIEDSQTLVFSMPAVEGVTLSVDSDTLSLRPGATLPLALRLESVGNVAESVVLTAELPPGVTLSGLSNQALQAGQELALPLSVSVAPGVPLNTTLTLLITADFGTPEPVTVEITLHVVAPGVEATSQAATTVREALGNLELADRLEDLSLALTNLVQNPASDIFRSQALAAIDAATRLMRTDPLLHDLADDLTAPRLALASASTPSEIQAAIDDLGAALDSVAASIEVLANSNFEVFLSPNVQVAQPGTPATFAISLHNIGLATSTYDISLGALPAGVTGSLSASSATLDRDEITTDLIVTITPPASEVFPFEFQVNIAVDGAPQIVKILTGALSARSEFLSVVEVKPSSPIVNPGDILGVTARLLNVVNRPQPVLISYQVVNSAGQAVFNSTPIGYRLDVQSSLLTAQLVNTQLGDLPTGQYAIVVRVTDNDGNLLPGGTGQGTIFIGSPVTATLSTNPDIVPPGSSTITNTLQIDTTAFDVSPPFVVGQANVTGASDAVRNGDYLYVAGTAGISVFNIAGVNLNNPQFVRTIGTRTEMLEVHGNLLVAVRGGNVGRTPNATRLDTYSLSDPANPQFLGTTGEIPYSDAADLLVTDTHAFVVLVNLHLFAGNDIFDQNGGLLAINITNPVAPFLDGDAVTAKGTPAGVDGVNDGVLFNEYGTNNDGIRLVAGIDQSAGARNTWSIVQASPTIIYLTGSSATGTDTQTGVGLVRVVDISDPRNMRLLRDVQLPGTVQAVGISIEGNRALVTASENGWNDGATDVSFTGNAVLATLDISNPAFPVVMRIEEQAELARGIGRARAVSLGGGFFAYGNLGAVGQPAGLFVTYANAPSGFQTSRIDAPAEILHLSASGDLVITADGSRVILYRVRPVEPLRIVGQANVTGATDAVRHGDYVYVTASAGISVYDVAGDNIDQPVLVRTVAGAAANVVRVQGDKLYTLRATSSNFVVSIYSLTDPANPTLLGATSPVPYSFAINMIVAGDHVYVVDFNVIFLLSNNDIFDHNGSVVSIDVSDPANPQVDGDAVTARGTPAGRDGVNDGVLFNEFGTSNDGVKVTGGIDQSGGSHNTWDGVQLDATTLLVAGSTATGTETQVGSAVIHVVDISDPQNPRVIRDLTIPGAIQAFSITLEGDRALVVGSTGGFRDFANSTNNGFTGTIVLATLDVSDHRNPVLLHAETTALSSRVMTFHEALGNGLFALGLGATSPNAGDAKLIVIDNSNPDQPIISGINVPSDIARVATANGLIYATSPTGLTIYAFNDLSAIPVTASVQIPKNTGVEIVPGSFNVPPTRIISGQAFDTLVWETNLAFGGASRQFTWQSAITGLVPGATREVTLATNIEYVLGAGGPLSLRGLVDTPGNGTSVAKYGNLAYISGTSGVSIVDVSDPDEPELLSTFTPGNLATGNAFNTLVIEGDRLIVASIFNFNNFQFSLSVYSLADPLNPVQIDNGNARFPYQLSELFVRGNTAFAMAAVFLGVNNDPDVLDQGGDFVAVGIQDPATYGPSDALFAPRTAGAGGFNLILGGDLINANTAILASTTAQGGDTQTGFGRVLITGTDSSNLQLIDSLEIPGTVLLHDIAVQGNRALVIGGTGGLADPATADAYGYTGRVTLTLLDVSSAADPQILGTTLVTDAVFPRGLGPATLSTDVTIISLGNNRYAVSGLVLAGDPVILLIDAADPANLLIESMVTPSVVGGLTYDGTFLYAASASGLGVYDLTSAGTRRQIALPPQNVVSRQVLSLNPGENFGFAGQEEQYTLTIENPTSQPVSYDLAVQGIPADWVDLATSVTVPAGGSSQVVLKITSDQFAAAADYNFIVTATTGGMTSSVEGALDIFGSFVQPADPQSHGVVVSLLPQSNTAGQGTSARYTARVTNTGSANDTFILSVNGLPPEFAISHEQVVFDQPPGAENFRDITITITPPAGTSADEYPFTVTAYWPSDGNMTSEAAGLLNVVEVGVDVDIVQDAGPPGSVLQLVVHNTGDVVETFDLSLAGPAAIVATLGATSVTLQPGDQQTVTITVGDIDFALPGALQLVGLARSRTIAAVGDSDTANIAIEGTLGMTAAFEDPLIEQPQPGANPFLLLVDNIGNLEDSYIARIVSTRGPVSASFTGPDGQPAQTIPVFILPGLAGGAILLNTTLLGQGPGDVTVQIQSLTNSQIVSTLTATLGDSEDTPPVITSSGGGDSASVSVAENTLLVANVDATGAAPLVFSIVGGADASKFTINAGSGVLSFLTPPNFENPTDVGGNNVYDVVVQVSDGTLTDSQTLAISVTNVNEAPSITTSGGGSAAAVGVVENTTFVTDVDASDPDVSSGLSFSVIGGADAAKFTIDASTGVLGFLSRPNFELPTDAGGNNVYEVTVQVSDGALTDTQAIFVTVTNANEPPSITSTGGGAVAAVSVAENTTLVTDVNASDPDNNSQLTYTIAGGPDAARFTIHLTTGVLSFLTRPDFESPTDADGNNVYEVVVRVNDGELVDMQTIAVTVTDVAEAAGFLAVGSDAGGKSKPIVKIFAADGSLIEQFTAYSTKNFKGGVRVAVGDVNGDGVPDVVTAPGRGHAPQVKVFDGRTLLDGIFGNAAELVEFQIFAYAASCKNGLYVAVGDVIGDGLNDIIVSPERGSTEIRVFENRLNDPGNSVPGDPFSNVPTQKFLPFGKKFSGGATVAAGDVDSVFAKQEVIVGNGSGMRTQIKAYNVASGWPHLVRSYSPFDAKFRGGVFVAAGDVNGDELADIIAGAARGGGSRVEIYDGSTAARLQSLLAYTDKSKQSSVRIAAKDADGDGVVDSLYLGQAADGKSKMIRRVDPMSASAVDFLFLNDPSLGGGFFLG